jgi:4-hydroxythreonine-4-phosphate dehydrogenase
VTPNPISRILITPGEPAGIGPDVVLNIVQKSWPAELIAIADPDLLKTRAKQLGITLQLKEQDPDLQSPSTPHQPGILPIIPIKLNTATVPGQLNPANAPYVIRTLEKAAELCTHKRAGAIVTAPVHKGVINQAGIAFTGHTEFFAAYCHVPLTVMLFVIDQLKVALATTHLPLAEVPSAITQERLQATLSILQAELKQKFHIHSPHILVCGLNPHAGENGYLGREEIEIITPLLEKLRKQDYHLEGPLPADTIFTQEYLQHADAILAMYHDQALPLVKYLGFSRAVNVTLGLPFIRTSVDHGTALSLAGTNTADPGSMEAAISLAIQLCKNNDIIPC